VTGKAMTCVFNDVAAPMRSPSSTTRTTTASWTRTFSVFREKVWASLTTRSDHSAHPGGRTQSLP
jgi:hypothetical protein